MKKGSDQPHDEDLATLRPNKLAPLFLLISPPLTVRHCKIGKGHVTPLVVLPLSPVRTHPILDPERQS